MSPVRTCGSPSVSSPSVLGSPAEPDAALQVQRHRRGGDAAPPAAPGARNWRLAARFPESRGLCASPSPRAFPRRSLARSLARSLGGNPPSAAPPRCPGAPRRHLEGPRPRPHRARPKAVEKADTNAHTESALWFQGASFAYSISLLSEWGRDYKITRRKEHEKVLLWQYLKALRQRGCGASSLTGSHRKC